MGLFFAFTISLTSALLILRSRAPQALKLQFAVVAMILASLGVGDYVVCTFWKGDFSNLAPEVGPANEWLVLAAACACCWYFSSTRAVAWLLAPRSTGSRIASDE